MTKYQGNYIGKSPTLSVRTAAGVWNIFDQSYNKRKRNWPNTGLTAKLISISGGVDNDYVSQSLDINSENGDIVAVRNGLVLHFDKTLTLLSARQATNTGYFWQYLPTGYGGCSFVENSSTEILFAVTNSASEGALGAGYCRYNLTSASATANVLATTGSSVNSSGILVDKDPDSIYYGRRYVATSVGSQRGGSSGVVGFNTSNQSIWGLGGLGASTPINAAPDAGLQNFQLQWDGSLSVSYAGYWQPSTPTHPYWYSITGGGTAAKALRGSQSVYSIFGAKIPNTTDYFLNDGTYFSKLNNSNQIVWQYNRPGGGGTVFFFHPSTGFLYGWGDTSYIACYSGISSTENTPVLKWRLVLSGLTISKVIPDNGSGILILGYTTAAGFGNADVVLISADAEGELSGLVYGITATKDYPSMGTEVTPVVSRFAFETRSAFTPSMSSQPTSSFTNPGFQNATSSFS